MFNRAAFNRASFNSDGEGIPNIEVGANQYRHFKPVGATFLQIAANYANGVCYSWYNHVTGFHEAHYAGRTYNEANSIPSDCSVFGFFDAATSIPVVGLPSSITIPNLCWFYGFLPGTANMTLADITTSMNAAGLDCQAVYRWDSAAHEYVSSGMVQLGEGITIYNNEAGVWTP